jgi:cyclophilin family peptidyl-prolyl cis-trans isomerase/HEAT repeat protein
VRRNRTQSRAVLTGLFVVWIASLSGQDTRVPETASLRYRMLVAEDARAVTPTDLAPLFEGLASPDPPTVQIAVRALGRLERPEFLPHVRRALASADSGVRAEAANALGQMATDQSEEVQRALRERLTVERDAGVLGAIYETLGRLPYAAADQRRVAESALTEAFGADASSATVRLGVAKGLEALIRGARGTGFVTSAATVAMLRRQAVAANGPGGSEADARIRRVALTALNATTQVDDPYTRAMLDSDQQVRRLAIAGVAADAGASIRGTMIAKGLVDRDPMVRYEALRVHGRSIGITDCAAQIAAVDDANPHVALLAIDQLASLCAGAPQATRALEAIAFVKPPAPPRRTALDQAAGDWRRPSHAIVSLVRRDPSAADWRPILETLAQHRVWQVRMYAARAAEFVKDAGAGGDATSVGPLLLEAFAADADANVREAAVAGLARVRGHRADAVYIRALDRPDAQVVIAACRALGGTANRGTAAEALLRGLQAITSRHQDTSRDARVAILERLRDVASVADAEALKPYLSDFDPTIAALTAEVLTKLTGQPHHASTTSITPLPLPSAATLRSLPTMMRVTMASGRAFDVRLFVDETPVTVWRIVRLARAGYYNGLTFHRIVPNFVIQGGSPGANEFVGDGPFMRDETGLRSNTRGTIGVSTRGRDTGDAQFYINTVDNPRLDHQYPVFGEIVRGLDVVDLIVEGDVIRTIEFFNGPPE